MFPVVAALVSGLLLSQSVEAGNFRGSGQLSKSELEATFQDEVADMHHHVTRFENELRQMYTSLPKNEHGHLGHEVVRYALYRFFAKQYGWHIKALEPNVETKPDYAYNYTQTWVPNYLQEKQESLMGDKGADLHALAVLAATIQDLVDTEAKKRIEAVYAAHGLNTANTIEGRLASKVLHSFFVASLAGNNLTLESREDVERLNKEFFGARKMVLDWVTKIKKRHFSDEQGSYDFKTVLAAAREIGQTYHSVNEDDCVDLRSTLTGMQSQKPGRVRLSVFYNSSKQSIWRFTESVAWLRALGALDESDPQSLSVIIPNYVQSQQNCLDGTALYAVCCSNPCEELAGQLEAGIGSSHAKPDRVAELVSKLPSANVAAPRELPATLLGRLEDIAVVNGGMVPMHGRLFAQWMHHAYPLECPYPHEAATNLQSAEEWARNKDEVGKEASEEAMNMLVAADQCAVDWQGKVECSGESTDIPWSSTEELLSTDSRRRSPCIAKFLMFGLISLLSAAVAALPMLRARMIAKLASIGRNRLALLAIALLAWHFGLLHTVAFSIAVVGTVATVTLAPRQACFEGLPMAKTV